MDKSEAAQPLHARITSALRAAGGRMSFYDLAIAVFPCERYPRAFEYQRHGGPPGCFLSLGKAVNLMRKAGLVDEWWDGTGSARRIICLRERAALNTAGRPAEGSAHG